MRVVLASRLAVKHTSAVSSLQHSASFTLICFVQSGSSSPPTSPVQAIATPKKKRLPKEPRTELQERLPAGVAWEVRVRSVATRSHAAHQAGSASRRVWPFSERSVMHGCCNPMHPIRTRHDTFGLWEASGCMHIRAMQIHTACHQALIFKVENRCTQTINQG